MVRLSGFQRAAATVWRRAALRVHQGDWFAVGVEIAIVVLGILIAFQVDRWGEARNQEQDERIYVQRLEEETRANVDALQRIIDIDRTNDDELLEVIRASAAPGNALPLKRRADYGCGMLHLPAARLQNIYQEMAGPRAAVLGRDARLRVLTGQALAIRHRAERQLDYFRDAFQRFGQRLDRYTVWQVDPNSGKYSCNIAIDEIRLDPAAQPALARLYRDRQAFGDVRRDEIETQKRLNARARCLLAGTCRGRNEAGA